MRMESSGLTDIGRLRSNNEDSYYLAPPLMIVADGMGGAAAGEVASSLAVETISTALKNACELLPSRTETTMRKAILEADRRIGEIARNKRELTGMGTTVVAALFCDGSLLIGYVGDSRAYIITGSSGDHNGTPSPSRDGDAPTVMLQKFDESAAKPEVLSIRRLTDDHSVVMDLVEAGIISEEDIRSHPLRNRITRSVGSLSDLGPEFLRYEPRHGDTLILCTDGLWEMVHEDLILAVVKSSQTPEEMCRRLVSAANDAGGQDNITVIIARFTLD
jgi:PPM family protein phosphatase